MTLAIVGAGSLGQTYAACLAASGQPVTLLASPRTAASLREAGAIRLRGAIELAVAVGKPGAPADTFVLTDDPADLPDGAGLIFTTKGHQLPAAARQVRERWPRSSDGVAWVAGVQNGIVKDDVLAQVFGPERVLPSVTIVGAMRLPDGPVLVGGRGATYFGEFAGGPSARADVATTAFNKAGLPTEHVADIKSVLWSKMCNATGLFGVTCLSRVSTSRLGLYPELARAYMGLVRETAAIANALGVEIGNYTGFPIKSYLDKPDEATVQLFAERAAAFVANPGPESRTSMHQDLEAGRPLEVEEIYADVVRRAERVGVPAPKLEIVRDLVRAIDPGRKPGG
jgi:2-dehydropantoate 2-reductase